MADMNKIAQDLGNIFSQYADGGKAAYRLARTLAETNGVHFVICVGKDGTNYSQAWAFTQSAERYFEQVCPVASQCEFKFYIWA